MALIWIILLFVLGLALIIKGGDFFVDAASWIAEVSGVPKFVIGATVVSLATTLPELLVSIFATAGGNLDIAVGNSIGSVVANIGLIMGISMVCLPSMMKRKDILGKGLLLIGCIALLWGFSFSGTLQVWQGVIIILLLGLFIFENLQSTKRQMLASPASEGVGEKEKSNVFADQSDCTARAKSNGSVVDGRGEAKPVKEKPSKKTIVVNILKFVFGAAFIVGGAELLVEYGSELAHRVGIPESIVAVTMVAVGTSLPELVTTISAIAKKQASLSIGNIIGANIIDLSLILPVCSFISGKEGLLINNQSVFLDMPVCLGLVLIAIVPSMITGKFARWQGVCSLVLYIAYIVVLCTVPMPI